MVLLVNCDSERKAEELSIKIYILSDRLVMIDRLLRDKLAEQDALPLIERAAVISCYYQRGAQIADEIDKAATELGMISSLSEARPPASVTTIVV